MKIVFNHRLFKSYYHLLGMGFSSGVFVCSILVGIGILTFWSLIGFFVFWTIASTDSKLKETNEPLPINIKL